MPALKDKLNQKVKSIETVPNSIIEEESVNEQESNLIILKPNQPDSFVPHFAITLNEARQRLSMLQEFVKEMMVADVDYGMIPGCKKPSLFKSGAEKLCDIYGFAKKVEIINRIEDWETKLFRYEVKVSLINKKTGLMEAEGIGSCNNREKKYVSQDPFNVINTIVKMAKKRALIDAVLSATRTSAIFTQDIEDFEELSDMQLTENSNSTSDNTQNVSTLAIHKQDAYNQKEIGVAPASRNQLALIMKLVAEKGIAMGEIKSLLQTRYSVNESKFLSTHQADDFIKLLFKYKLKHTQK
jgi:hypothetical protein